MVLSKHIASLIIIPSLALGSYSGVRIVQNIRQTGSLIASSDSTHYSSSSKSSSTSSKSSSSSSSSALNPLGILSSSAHSELRSSSSSSVSTKTEAELYEEYLKWLEDQGALSSERIQELRQAASAQSSSSVSSTHTESSSISSESRSEESSVSSEQHSAISSEERVESSSTASQSSGDLGCFTLDGMWTQDRELCAENQTEYIRKQAELENRTNILIAAPIESEEEKELRIRISERFTDDAILERKRVDLVNAMNSARTRIEELAQKETITEGAKEYFVETVVWLQTAQEYFTAEERSELDVTRMVTAVQETLENVAQLVQSERITTPEQTVDMNSIVERTEKLLQKFRLTVIELVQAGESIDQNAVTSYVNAQNWFDALKAPCLERREGCENLDSVLEQLAKARQPLEAAMERHPEVRTKIESSFQ